MRAYCWSSGLIEFGRTIPGGALPIARGPAKRLRAFIEPVARHGYRTQVIHGRPIKVRGSDMLLVPGVPEAPHEGAKLQAWRRWRKWIATHTPPAGVEVL